MPTTAFGTGKSTTGINRFDARADWVRSDKHSLYFRWSQAWEVDRGLVFPEWGIGESSTYSPNPRGQATLGNTFMLSPTMVFNVLIGHGNWTEQTIPNVKASPTAVGLPAAQVARFHVQDVMPSFGVANFSGLGVGNNGQLRHPERTETLQANFTKQWNRHNIKFGYTMELGYMNGPGDGGWLRAPSFSFDQNLTSGPTVVNGTTTSGNCLASLLLGVGSGNAPYPASETESHHYYGVYVQDAWRVSAADGEHGMRMTCKKPTTDRYDRYSTFNFTAPSPISVPGLNLKGSLSFRGQQSSRLLGYRLGTILVRASASRTKLPTNSWPGGIWHLLCAVTGQREPDRLLDEYAVAGHGRARWNTPAVQNQQSLPGWLCSGHRQESGCGNRARPKSDVVPARSSQRIHPELQPRSSI